MKYFQHLKFDNTHKKNLLTMIITQTEPRSPVVTLPPRKR